MPYEEACDFVDDRLIEAGSAKLCTQRVERLAALVSVRLSLRTLCRHCALGGSRDLDLACADEAAPSGARHEAGAKDEGLRTERQARGFEGVSDRLAAKSFEMHISRAP
jgi:hypothetical protein